MQVTDIQRKKGKSLVTGFYMDGYLKENLDDIPSFLKEGWDCVGIVSGRGKVRMGKSTLAMQIAYYVAWLLAGGIMETERVGQRKTELKLIKMTKPPKKVNFSLDENVVFSAEQLQEQAKVLFDKYGKNQVLVYDEGRQGLESARTMEALNKGMEDFLQECGSFGHVIIIVLPNFFKLHEDYAVARSLFLVDVYINEKYKRGFFNFYNELQKEYLYYFGKKKIGVTAKYFSARRSFGGKFGPWLPFDKKEYEDKKRDEIDKKRVLRRERNLQLQRDLLVFLMNKHYDIPYKEIKQKMYEVANFEIGERTLNRCISRISETVARLRAY